VEAKAVEPVDLVNELRQYAEDIFSITGPNPRATVMSPAADEIIVLAARVQEMRVVFQVLAKGPKHYQTPDMVASELRVFCGYAQRVGNEFDVSCPTPDTSAQILARRDAAIWMEAAAMVDDAQDWVDGSLGHITDALRAKADELLKGLEKEHG